MKSVYYFLFGIIIGVLLMLTACSTHQSVPYERVVLKTDTLYKNKVTTDTFRIRDSVFVETYTRGDTVYKSHNIWHWRDRFCLSFDTIYKVVAPPIPEPIEHKATWWEQTQMWVGKISICIVGFALLTLLIWLIHRKR